MRLAGMLVARQHLRALEQRGRAKLGGGFNGKQDQGGTFTQRARCNSKRSGPGAGCDAAQRQTSAVGWRTVNVASDVVNLAAQGPPFIRRHLPHTLKPGGIRRRTGCRFRGATATLGATPVALLAALLCALLLCALLCTLILALPAARAAKP